MAEFHVARQPIFLYNKSVFAYELLYRSSGDMQSYTENEGDKASMRVLSSNFLSTGFSALTGGKPAFVNFTDTLLKQGTAMLFPKEQLYVEVLETVKPDEDILKACRELKKAGYKLVLDDFMAEGSCSELERMADIIKVDFRVTTLAQQVDVFKRLNYSRFTLFLAEKVETYEEFDIALDMGYTLFQGYFFTKPVTLSVTTLPVGSVSLMMLMKEIVSREPDIDKIRAEIEMDVGLAYEILRLVNSAYYTKRKRIGSIRQALAYLGLEGIRKWVMMSALRKQSQNVPGETINLSIIRSRFMEQLSSKVNEGHKKEEYALTGLFSLLEVLTECPFDILLSQIAAPDSLYSVLAQKKYESKMGQCFLLIQAYEKAMFQQAQEIAQQYGMSLDEVAAMYNASVKWLYEFPNL